MKLPLRMWILGVSFGLLGCDAPQPAATNPPGASSRPASPTPGSFEAESTPPVASNAQARQPLLVEQPIEKSPPQPEPPPPPPEIPAQVRERLEAVGARIHDKHNGYAIDIRNKSNFTDAEIDLVVECPQVIDLTLEGVSITDEGLKKLVALPGVTRLILNGSPISSEGLKTLTSLPLHKNLFSIGLRGTKISDSDVALLRGFPRLVRLDLSQTAVTDTSLPDLERLPLNYLNVAETQMTEAGLQQLRQKKPKLVLKR